MKNFLKLVMTVDESSSFGNDRKLPCLISPCLLNFIANI